MLANSAAGFGGLVTMAPEKNELLSDNVHAIYQTAAGILILAGLAHMTMDYGHVYKFRDIPENPTIMSFAELDGSPEASAVDAEGNIVIAPTHSILRVDIGGQVDELYKTTEYLTYPTSAAIDKSGSIYVAMRFFVLRLIPQGDGYKAEWLMPEYCRSFKLDKRICTCNGEANNRVKSPLF